MKKIKQINDSDLSGFASIQLILILRNYISAKRKRQLFISFTSVLFAGIAEIASLSITLPFITLLTDKNSFLNLTAVKRLINILNINPNQLISLIFYLLIFIVIVSGLMRLFNIWLIHKVVMAIGNELSTKCFDNILNQPYSFHLRNNTSKNIASLEKNIDAVILSLESSILAFTGLFIIFCIILTLLRIDYWITISTAIIFASSYYLISNASKNILLKNSKFTVRKQPQKIKVLQEGIGGIRDIILDNNQNYFVKLFSNIDKSLKKRIAQNIFVSSSPRYIIESLSIIIICSLSYFIYNKNYETFNSIAVLGTFALGAQKLLPNMQTVYRCWQSITNKRYELIDIIKLLKLQNIKSNKSTKKLELSSNIKLKNISFGYTNDKPLYKNLNLKINVGQRIGIIGPTGSGKSTLVDLIMGLIKPQDGEDFIDNLNLYKTQENLYRWRSAISHVPQNIFLSDRSFIENIAFGVPKEDINFELIRKASQKACIEKFILSTENGYESLIGERGIRLSGGQRQRLGIARAIYKNTNLLVFDEATSSLDNNTEDQIINTIYSLERNLTIIIIAHRLRTVSKCDRILELRDGIIKEINPNQIKIN